MNSGRPTHSGPKRWLAALAFAGGLASSGLSTDALATTLAPLTTDQMVDTADLVVRGEVEQIWTELNPTGKVVTRVQVHVDHVLKGDDGLEGLVIEQPGGTWAGFDTRVEGTAQFSEGELVLLFLTVKDNANVGIVGWMQGKYTVRLDPYSRSEIVQRYQVPHDRVYDHRFLPLPRGQAQTYAQIEDEIVRRVTSGWDGRAIPGVDTTRLERIHGTSEVK